MKKLIALACCLLFLNGCAKTFESDLPQMVNDLLIKQNEMVSSLGANRTKDYYKYYLPLDMGTRESTQLGEVFIKNESTILMNFDPSAIIIHEYYNDKTDEQIQQSPGDEDITNANETTPNEDAQTGATATLQKENLIQVEMNVSNSKVTYQGTYSNNDNTYLPYTLSYVNVDNQYIIYFDASIAQFYCISSLPAIQSDIHSMFIIAKSIAYDTDYVLEHFSMKKATSSQQQSIDTLQQNLPSVGSIPDLINQMEQLNGN